MAAILDLTRVLDQHLPIYTSGSYSDPPLEIEPGVQFSNKVMQCLAWPWEPRQGRTWMPLPILPRVEQHWKHFPCRH